MNKMLRLLMTLLVGVALGLGVLSRFMDEVSLNNTTLIMAQPEVAWTTATDTQRLPEWIGGLESTTELSENTLRLDFVSGAHAIVTITDTTPISRIDMIIDTDREHAVGTMTFEPNGGSTVLNHSLQVRGLSLARRAVLPMIKPRVSLKHMAMLDNLEAVIEQRPSMPADTLVDLP